MYFHILVSVQIVTTSVYMWLVGVSESVSVGVSVSVDVSVHKCNMSVHIRPTHATDFPVITRRACTLH